MVVQSADQTPSDLVVVPLRLALQTKQAKLVEPALDCFHVRATISLGGLTYYYLKGKA